MKLLSSSVKSLLIVMLATACAKKASLDSTESQTLTLGDTLTVSNKTATGFKVTWNPATDTSSSSANLEYKLVHSTGDNLTTAEAAEANGTVALNWTPNVLSATLSSLNHSTTYYFAVLVKNESGKMAIAKGSTTTLCSGKKMFLATVSGGNFGGKAGADAACAAQRPGGTGTYKAMVSDGTGTNTSTGFPGANARQACFGNCEASNLYVQDWVFTANTTYCTDDYVSRVGTTGVTYPVLYVPVANVLSSTPIKLFTGFNIAWGNAYTDNCSNWSSTSGTFVGGTTAGIYTGQSGTKDFISTYPFPSCAGTGAVVCVEQ